MRHDVDPSTGKLYDWSEDWSQPDPKIKTLKIDTEDLKLVTQDHAQELLNLKAEVGMLKDINDTLALNLRLVTLFSIGKIDSEQLKTLKKMLTSVDDENRIVALETINNLENDN